MTINWRYWVHEEQKYVPDADAYLIANPTHQITERFIDDANPAGSSGIYIPDNNFAYVRVDGDLYQLSVSGNDITITPSGGSPQIVGSGTYLPLAGGTMGGDLILDHDPTAALEAVTKQYVDSVVTSGAAAELAVYSGFAEGQFVNVAGDTMTGFLTLSADPTAAGHAANKNYVDQEIAALSGAVVTDTEILVISGALQADIDSRVLRAGDTMTGFLTLSADPTASGHAANKNYVDTQLSTAQPMVQVDFTTGTDLDVTQNTLPLNGGTVVNPTATVYTVNANSISVGQTGFYRVTWNVECQKTNGSTQRRLLQTNVNHNGSQLAATSAACYVRDATNNHGSAANSYTVEVTSAGQTIGIRARQTGSGGGGSVVFDLSSGHLLIERIGDN